MNAQLRQIVSTAITQGVSYLIGHIELIEQYIREGAHLGAIRRCLDQVLDQSMNASRWDRRAHINSPADRENDRRCRRNLRCARSSPSGHSEARYIPSCSR